MSRIALAVAAFLVLAQAAFAADAPQGQDPMAGWKPPQVKNEKQDRQEIQALMQSFERAAVQGDIDAAAALIDFPVLMVTDDSKGEASGEAWDREKWLQVMRPMYKPMPGVKMAHKPQTFLLSDSLATVTDAQTVTMGKKTIPMRSASLLIRKGGKWKVKAMVEGGWGDMPMGDAGTGQGAGQGSGGAPGGDTKK